MIAGLYGIYHASTGSEPTAGQYQYQVGDPGPGNQAPGFTLLAGTGDQICLADDRGQTVLLYLHEGLGCQPCWNQIHDLEENTDKIHTAGIDQVLAITTNDIADITRKVTDESLSTPVLSDSDLTVSTSYDANKYGMMGGSRDGHSFLLVDPEGTITWRADYGGAPDYTMYLPVDALLADLRDGTQT